MCLLEGGRMAIFGSCMNSTMFYCLLTVQSFTSSRVFMNPGIVTITYFPINRDAQMALVSLSIL